MPLYSTHREFYEEPHYAAVSIIPLTPECFPQQPAFCAVPLIWGAMFHTQANL